MQDVFVLPVQSLLQDDVANRDVKHAQMVAGTTGSIHLLVESNTSCPHLVFAANATRITRIRLQLIFMGPEWEHCPGAVHTSVGEAHQELQLVDTLSVGVDRIQRNFEAMHRQVESWRQSQISDAEAKLIFYSAFVDGKLDAPRSLLPEVHQLYFEPEYPEFAPRMMWSLSNAFTNAFKKLGPAPQFKVTAKLGEFLSQLPA